MSQWKEPTVGWGRLLNPSGLPHKGIVQHSEACQDKPRGTKCSCGFERKRAALRPTLEKMLASREWRGSSVVEHSDYTLLIHPKGARARLKRA
jgi:hypothetical protein